MGLPAALGRAIDGPVVDCNSSTNAGVQEPARLVSMEVVGPQAIHILAQDMLSSKSFDYHPSKFSLSWKLRPFPDYSAALEPLAALALIGIGLRAHTLVQGPTAPPVRAFLDVTCGTGTVAAAAKYCKADWPVLAGDVNPTMSQRCKANLEAAFAGQTCDLAAGPPDGPFAGIGIRRWDATKRWPLPCLDDVKPDGAGLLVASNLPWGKALDLQVEAAKDVARCLAREFPKATLVLIAPEEIRRNCEGWLTVLFSEPVGKKATLLVGRGV